MIYFESDYEEGAHPKVLDLLLKTNMEQTTGYGKDEWCEKARNIIKDLCGTPDADVHFLVGGTQANCTVIDAVLKPYEGVISADTGHINVHETGTVEAFGHKVITVPGKDGKLTAKQVEDKFAADGYSEHVVRPGMVYISFPTEYGTLYTKKELEELYAVCKRLGLPLFIDGARLGYGLMAKSCDVTLKELAKLCDVFYIGGTKVGTMCGEAVVFTDPSLSVNFRYSIKRHGGLFAKGRLLGVQFAAILEDDTYFEISKQADILADRIRAALDAKGIEQYMRNDTNQIFVVISKDHLEKLSGEFSLSVQEPVGEDHMLARICTSWATTEENVDKLIAAINAL